VRLVHRIHSWNYRKVYLKKAFSFSAQINCRTYERRLSNGRTQQKKDADICTCIFSLEFHASWMYFVALGLLSLSLNVLPKYTTE
jgi:hypothetical protein